MSDYTPPPMPERIRRALDDPDRPRATSLSEAYGVHDFIVRREWPRKWESGVILGRAGGYSPYPHRDAAYDEWLARVADGLNDDEFFKPGESMRDDGYLDISDMVMRELRREADIYSAQAAVAEAAAEAEAWAVPDDGPGLGLAELAERWECSISSAKREIARRIESGTLRFEEVPTSTGGKPKKVYWGVSE